MGLFDGGADEAKKQLTRANTLQDTAFNQMLSEQDQVRSSVSPYLSGDVGYDPRLLATMMTQFLQQSSGNYSQAGQNLRSAMASRGVGAGNAPIGGDYVRGVASLEGARASDVSQGVLGVNLQNLQMALQNKWNAANLISGQAAQMTYPINTFGGQSSSALAQYIEAKKNSFGGQFASTLGASLGKGLGQTAITGLNQGISKLSGGKFGSPMGGGGSSSGSSGGGGQQ